MSWGKFPYITISPPTFVKPSYIFDYKHTISLNQSSRESVTIHIHETRTNSQLARVNSEVHTWALQTCFFEVFILIYMIYWYCLYGIWRSTYKVANTKPSFTPAEFNLRVNFTVEREDSEGTGKQVLLLARWL